jgi:hypothetical protein
MSLEEAALDAGVDSVDALFNALESYVPRNQEVREYIDSKKREVEDFYKGVDFIYETDEFAEYLGVVGNYTSGKLGAQAQLNEKLAGRKGKKPALARSASTGSFFATQQEP